MTNFAVLGIFRQRIQFGKIPYISVENLYYGKKDRILRTIYLIMTYFDHLGYFWQKYLFWTTLSDS